MTIKELKEIAFDAPFKLDTISEVWDGIRLKEPLDHFKFTYKENHFTILIYGNSLSASTSQGSVLIRGYMLDWEYEDWKIIK